MITPQEFAAMFHPVTKQSGRALDPEMLDQMYRRVRDLTMTELSRLADLTLDRHKFPKVHDVVMIAAEIRNARPRVPITDEYRFQCAYCADLGVLKLVSTIDGFETLALCDCKFGNEQQADGKPYRLPQWNRDFRDVFTRGPCPVVWFKPEVVPRDEKKKGLIAFKDFSPWLHSQEYWLAKISIAEQYWEHEIGKAAGI